MYLRLGILYCIHKCLARRTGIDTYAIAYNIADENCLLEVVDSVDNIAVVERIQRLVELELKLLFPASE